MAGEGPRSPRCPETGVAIPECSCERCLIAMLSEFSPHLLNGEIRVRRLRPRRGPPRRREAA
ncbi:MAG TPA: hypothetical protein VK326_05630 [Solirubrobacterales bacterium]|nr:hypothetical protein [Solirubrobacterales bacterium]